MDNSTHTLSTQPNEHELIMQARKLVEAEREVEALKVVQQVLKINPDNFKALLLYGQLSPNSERAIKALKKVLTVDPRNAEARIQLRILQREAAGRVPEKPKIDVFSQLANDDTVKRQDELLTLQQPINNTEGAVAETRERHGILDWFKMRVLRHHAAD